MVRSRAESHCRVWDSVPQTAAGRSAKGELKNSPVDCFLRGNALQERAFLYSFAFVFSLIFYYKLGKCNVYEYKGAAFTCKACPYLETVEGFMRCFAPLPTRDAVSGLCQRDIIPLESQFIPLTNSKTGLILVIANRERYKII